MNSSHILSPPLSNSTSSPPVYGWISNLLIQGLRRSIAATQQVFLQRVQTALQNHFYPHLQLHPYGYCYAPIFCNRLVELLILQWPIGSESKPHSHGASINFTRVLSGHVLERKYHVSGGQLRVILERIITPGQWAWTLPFEIHELVALDTSAETMHLYFPGRG